MFSGKTARLIERLCAARENGERVVAFKHVLDTRYEPQALATHDRLRFPAIPTADTATIEQRSVGAEVVGIDEGQFFGPELVTVCQSLRELGKHVIVAGIDHNAWGRDFEPLPQLKAVADHVEIMEIPCTACGRPARYSQRMVPVVDGQMVGGPDEYQPRCRACFVPLPE